PDGIVWEADGRVALGPLGRGAGMISRRSELRDLAGQIEASTARIDAMAGELSAGEAAVEGLGSAERRVEPAVHQAETPRAEAAALVASLAAEMEKRAAEQPAIASEAAEIARLMQAAGQREEASRQSLGTMQRENSERERLVAELQAKLEELNG